jgi:hypothetical protein
MEIRAQEKSILHVVILVSPVWPDVGSLKDIE